jgi:hypothetical protein
MAKRSESRMLETTGEVMDALGGVGAVSALTGARYKTVWPWADGGNFPVALLPGDDVGAEEKRLSAPPSLWGQVTTAEMEKAAA